MKFFRQHAASIYGFVRQSVCQFVSSKIFYATSKQGRRLSFGMLTYLTNIRSTKVLHHASCIAGRKLRFGMLTALTNIRSTKVLY